MTVRFQPLVIAFAVAGLAGSSAQAALYHFDFSGTVNSSMFTPYPLDAQAAGVQAGDRVRLTFDLDSSVADTASNAAGVYPGAVKNINYSFVDRGLTYAPTAAAEFQVWPFATGPAFYRWDVRLPSAAPSEANTFTLSFWLRKNDANLPSSAIPQTIDASQFNFLRSVNIFRGDPFVGGSSSLTASIENTPVPEPAAAAALAGVALVTLRRRRRA